jgi:alpha-galactosidase/6-phospho-beta-glucosidase family protein
LSIRLVCELPWTTLQEVCAAHGCDSLRELDFGYCGVNHLGWLYEVSSAGRKLASAVPLKYMQMHITPERILSLQRASSPRGKIVARLSAAAMSVYAHGTGKEILDVLTTRPAPWYDHCLAPILRCLAGERPRIPFFFTTLNGNTNPSFRQEDVLEIAQSGSESQFVPRLSTVRSPEWIIEQVSQFVRYETVAAAAIKDADRNTLQAALAIHPWVREKRAVGEIAQTIIDQSDRGQA